MDSIAEILEAVNEKRSDVELLRIRMEKDFDLLALTEYVPDFAGYEAYTSSAPRNYYDKVTDALNRAQLTIQIKMAEDATEAQRRAASTGELYLFGALQAIDRNLRKQSGQPLREQMGFHICVRGWYGLRLLVYVPRGERETVFEAVPWDIMHTVWEQGPQGLIWAAYQYEASKAYIDRTYGITIPGKTAILTDFWDTEQNAVIIGSTDWGKEPTEHKIGHVPVLIGRVGSMPSIMRKDNSLPTLELQGDSIWTASRGLYKPQNQYVSWLMDMTKKAVAGSLVHESQDGTKKLAGDPYLAWTEIQLSTDAREKLYPLETPKAPPEMAAVMQVIQKDLQQSTLPYPLAYGGTEEAMSGRALSVLNDNTLSAYSPRTGALARVYTWVCEELLDQFANKRGVKAAKLSGYDPKETFFTVTVKPRDIDPSWFVEVKVEPRLPRDKEAEIQQGLAATAKRGPDDIPLVSKQTAREEYLRLRDPDAESDKVLAEMGESLPPIVAANVAAALKRRGKDELAEQVMVLLGAPGGRNGQPPGGTPGPSQVPPELIDAIIGALMNSGNEQLAEALFMALQGPIGPPSGVPPGGNGAGAPGPGGMPPVVAAWGRA